MVAHVDGQLLPTSHFEVREKKFPVSGWGSNHTLLLVVCTIHRLLQEVADVLGMGGMQVKVWTTGSVGQEMDQNHARMRRTWS